MKNIIEDSFTGVLTIGKVEGYNAFFSINGNVVKILPLDKECRETIDRMSGMDGKGLADASRQWLYGFTEDNCNVAILKQSRLHSGLTSGLDMKTAQFKTPLIVKSTAVGRNIDLSTFDSIEFYGGIVDILHNPDQAIDWNGNTISFKSSDNYTKEYGVEVNGEHFRVTYSVNTTALSQKIGKLPDLSDAVHSILKFTFQSSKKLEDIEKYYSYAMSLFQFCTGRLNVCSEVRLYKNDVGRPILLYLNDGFEDYASDLDCLNVIRFGYLGEFMPKLLKLLNEDSTRPHLNFLPKRNSDVNNILYTDVNDLCIAFEIEYSCSKIASSKEIKGAAKELTEVLFDVIGKRENCPDIVKDKAKAILNSQLKGFSPALKEKIAYICELNYEYAKAITEQPGHNDLGISTFYSREEYEKKIADFVKIRNSASHTGITWNGGIDIFSHLKLYIYFSVLTRTGVPQESVAGILSWMFSRLF